MLRIVDLIRNPHLWEEVADLYVEIFKEEPWDEDYTREDVMKLMTRLLSGRGAVEAFAGVVGVKRRKAVSFTWMYEIFKDDLKEGTRFSPELDFLFKDQKKVFYFQEVGTKKEYRRRGIGEKLARKLLKKGTKKGAGFVVLSTNTKAMAAKSMFSKVGFKDSGIVRQPKELGRTYWILEL